METALKIGSIAIGGALGAVARYLMNFIPVVPGFGKFPLPTFLVNIIGSALAGFFVIVFADKVGVSENLRMAVIVGFLGAFTTFSTFEVETYGLVREKQFAVAGLYVALSVLCGFIGVAAGAAFGRRL